MTRLVDLLRRLLDETRVERLRLSSVEPMDFSDDLLEPDGGIAAYRETCACAAAIGIGHGACAGCIASTGPAIMRIGSRRRAR